MKRILTILLTIIFASSFGVVYADDISTDMISTKDMLEQSEYKKGELIVIFDDSVSNRTIKNVIASEDASCKDIIEVSEDSKASLVKISSEDTMATAIEKFKDNDKVQFVQPNYKYTFNEDDNVLPDPKYQYHLNTLKINDVWNLIESHDYTPTKVAVLDTGVDVLHEDLQETLISNEGYMLTVGGNEVLKDYDIGEHGTHVSGIIGATYGNHIGVSGVASGHNNDLIDLMVVGTSFNGQSLYTADIIAAVNYAKENGAQVMNMSFGGEGRDRAMEAAIKDAYDAGIVMVAAAGNEESDVFNSPSDFKEVISVNASNILNEPTYWSNYGLYKDISAPGNNILSTVPGDEYEFASGTSMASPVVAGIAALVLDANPNLTPAEVYNILCASTGAEDFDEYLAYGVVNPLNAVTAAYEASASTGVDRLTIKTESAEVLVGDNIYLETLITPATSLKSVTWTSLDPDIASVDPVTGKVTGLSEGVAAIKGAVDGKEVVCIVNVKPSVAQASITITNKDELEYLAKGDYGNINVKILPENSTNKEVYYYSSNRKIIDIDEIGYYEAKTPGTATVTVKSFDGSYTDSVVVTVCSDTRRVAITSYSPSYKMLVGDTYTYAAKAYDVVGNDITAGDHIIWSSTNRSVARIDKNTGVVTALEPGVTYIVATSTNAAGDNTVDKAMKLTVGKENYKYEDYNLRVTSKTYNSVTLAWNKIPVASSYIVSRSDTLNGVYTPIKEGISGTTFTDKDLKTGKTYYYIVKARYNEDKVFGISYKRSAKLVLNKPTITLNNTKRKTITVSWKKVTGATGYTVYRSTSLNGTYTALKSVTTLTYSNTNLTTGKKYYYKVKAYRTVDGKKVYSDFSNALGKEVK